MRCSGKDSGKGREEEVSVRFGKHRSRNGALLEGPRSTGSSPGAEPDGQLHGQTLPPHARRLRTESLACVPVILPVASGQHL